MDSSIWLFIGVGFLAQMIDGALGMAYGVSSNTFLLSIGVPPAAASASVHAAEVVTTAVSGFSHWRFGNIDKSCSALDHSGDCRCCDWRVYIDFPSGRYDPPFINAYLLVMGLIILRKALSLRKRQAKSIPRFVSPLGFVGGFFDALGGGGWGPIVTTTWLHGGTVREPPSAR
jgi:uncharacterized protein